MKKKTLDEKAAEKWFDRWWVKKDRYRSPFQIEIQRAFLHGARYGRRTAIEAVKALPVSDPTLDYAPIYAADFREQALDAIRKRGRK